MPFTSESASQAAHKGHDARRAAVASGSTPKGETLKAPGATAVAERPPTEPEMAGPDGPGEGVLPAADDILAGLMALASGLQDKKKQEGAVEELGKLLSRIDFRAYPDLAQSDVIQQLVERVTDAQKVPTNAEPGSPIGENMTALKREWTWRDVMANPKADPALEYVAWEPRFSDVLIWNGLKIRVTDGVEVRTPRVFKEIHDESRRGLRVAKEHAEWLFRKRDGLSDPTVLGKQDDLQGQHTRGYINSGVFSPGGGLSMLAPDEETFKMAEAMAGEGGTEEDDGGETE